MCRITVKTQEYYIAINSFRTCHKDKQKLVVSVNNIHSLHNIHYMYC